jgi:hypothetical protein
LHSGLALTPALWLFALQGLLGAFDTLYYHEWRARLPALGAQARIELKLHAARDFIYAIVFVTLPVVEWRGAWSIVLGALLAFEIAITLADFIVEDRVRKPIGGVYPGERATHAIMGIIYGAALACLFPAVLGWAGSPTALVVSSEPADGPLIVVLRVMGAGVFVSGLRDLYAAMGWPGASFPWRAARETSGAHAKRHA